MRVAKEVKITSGGWRQRFAQVQVRFFFTHTDVYQAFQLESQTEAACLPYFAWGGGAHKVPPIDLEKYSRSCDETSHVYSTSLA